MEVKNHLLYDNGKQVPFYQTPNTSGAIRSFEFLIVHDDEGASMEGTSSWILNPKSNVSYHILVGKKGEVRQYAKFDRRVWHAGKSSWKGFSDLNWYSIGVCLQNRGGEDYTDIQISSYIEVCKAIVKAYGIKDTPGHKEVSPGRKFDPNPKFPWERFRKEVFGTQDGKSITKRTAADLHIREGAGTQYKSLGVLSKGTEVCVLSEKKGWSEVLVCSLKLRGHVSSNYIK